VSRTLRLDVRTAWASHADLSNTAQLVWPSLIIAAGYYAGCLTGFALRFPSSGISFFWPPTAVLTTGLLLSPASRWPFLVISALAAHALAHAQNGVPIGAWPIQFLGNAAQAVLTAVIMTRYSRIHPFLADSRSVLTFVIASLAAPAIASLIPASIYVRLGWAPAFALAWFARTVTNAVSSLTLIPALFAMCRWIAMRPSRLPARTWEFVVLLVTATGAHFALGSLHNGPVLDLSLSLYAPAPFWLWATVRFGTAGLSLSLLWTTLLTTLSVLAGHGPLVGSTPTDAVLGIQMFLGGNAVLMMFIAGLLKENRDEHRALVDIERQNSAILRAHPDLLFLQTRDGQFLRSYATASRRLDGDTADVVGRDIRDVFSSEVADRFVRACDAASATEAAVLEYTQAVERELRRYEARFIAVDDDRVLSVIRDITERHQAEYALRETQHRYAMATAAGGIGVWDLNVLTGKIRVEGRLRSILGYGDDEVGDDLETWLGLVTAQDRASVQTRLEGFTSGAIDCFEVECRMRHKDGTLRWIASKGGITEKVDGRPARILGTYADITERKEAAMALRDATDALARGWRISAMAELSASLAHELNQPLTAIVANANACVRWIDAGASSAEVRDALNDLVLDGRRAGEIVGRIRKMFSNQPGQLASLNMNDLVREIVKIVEPRLRESHVTLEVRLDDTLQPVLADLVQMRQVLLNLILNAVDAMAETPSHRRVLQVRSRQCRRAVVVGVRDAGRGFDAKDRARMFEPFVTTKSSGTGMGLAISRSIIESHGGSLTALTNRDEGATFRFWLPMTALAEPQNA
jgi:PAS domain S-box-containing protein